MKIAKRTLFATNEKLAEVFGLPEGVEILAVRKTYDEGFEFLIASAGEVELNGCKVTVESNSPVSMVRRLSLDTLQEIREPMGNVKIDINIHNINSQKDIDNLADELSKILKNRGKV
ncbi:hypothetical protein PQE75_gp082 [Bacillus phage vB_BcoS-136]|uniref:Uncharacterized protein n=1 Tax=Bacillus phage vB_BcoS-136 TaxID=2419619 RepID=A0A3G3BVG3_9CAUD|nr:hypothetical protein PQE75_gp082 [Bacillus phage vB_BcoS-136]AYP68214.1 hypothetical protein vBBcoS136_00082 [Bacillus phage vB_BcoS-136]